jgi:hypothetical protein
VDASLHRYVTGVGLPEGSPMLALRTFVVERLPFERQREREAVLKALHAILADLKSERVDRLSVNEEHFEYFKNAADISTSQDRSGGPPD